MQCEAGSSNSRARGLGQSSRGELNLEGRFFLGPAISSDISQPKWVARVHGLYICLGVRACGDRLQNRQQSTENLHSITALGLERHERAWRFRGHRE